MTDLIIFDFSIFRFLKKYFPKKYFSEIDLRKKCCKKFLSRIFFRENIFSWIQKQKLRPALYFPKHPKTLPTDQNSQNGSQKTGGGQFNYWTQFIIAFVSLFVSDTWAIQKRYRISVSLISDTKSDTINVW